MDIQAKADRILKGCRERLELEWLKHAPTMSHPIAHLSEAIDGVGLAIEELDDLASRLDGASVAAAQAIRAEGDTPGLIAVLIAMEEGLTIRHIPCP